ncbi:MAG TPA: DegQ family serine endoprotease [Candidatus Competibacteraceae bacterium]|nr:DegQ family serine endoprotease [Candidatus Competibacteraceae bacterium]HQA26561.1 DegQ family serine endoprotease [Candidatus Competibacteraceae bacterium]HQD56958.1 DegQ family serine endoprotease [Candidatus Competibacteraceae bacterium]
MKIPGFLLPAALLALGLAVAAPPPVQAGLPAIMDNQALPSLAPMLERVTPAVVNIATESRVSTRRNPLLEDPFFRRFFNIPDQPRERKAQSVGSGVVVDAKRGYVITNHHVVEGADTITVTLRDGRQLNAKVIGSDSQSDVAVIQIPSGNLTALQLADSDALRVGDFVVAIGNPFGLGQTVTSGIVSALGRAGLGIQGYEDFIQTDASINPGNSGGALVNLRGELVGVNTAIIAPSGGNVGIGFAIPANMVSRVMNQIVTHGTVRRGQLGISVQDLTPDLARAFNIPATQGAVIAQVSPRSAAARAGVKTGDVVLNINGKPVHDGNGLRNIIGLLEVGETVRLDLLRDGKPLTIEAKLGEYQPIKLEGATLHPQLAGVTFEDIGPNSPLAGEVQGVVAANVESGSPAARAGLHKSDVIIGVNRQRVGNTAELQQLAANGDSPLLLNLLRGRDELVLVLR